VQSLEFEFENEKDMREIVKKLWDGLGVSGEMAVRPLSGGRWRLEINAEKEVRESTLEKFAAYRVDKGD
jgi:hypothetical protein